MRAHGTTIWFNAVPALLRAGALVAAMTVCAVPGSAQERGAEGRDAPAAAKGIDGVYVVDGRDVGRETYKGVAEIRRSGSTYQMVWQIGPTAFLGTGLYAEGVLSVAFRDVQGRVLGLGVYSLQDDKTLAGVFTFVGSDKTGSEMLSPMEGHPPPRSPKPERD